MRSVDRANQHMEYYNLGRQSVVKERVLNAYVLLSIYELECN